MRIQIAEAYRFEDAGGKPGGRRGFQIAVGVIEQRWPQTVVTLAAGKRGDLYLQGILQLPVNSIIDSSIIAALASD